MTRARWAIAGAAVLALLAAGAIALVRDAPGDAAAPRPLRARATLSDRIVLFGDTVRAQVELAVDRRRIDPDAIDVRASFAPWRRVAPPQVTRSDAGSSSLVRIVYALRCLKQACEPERELLPAEFEPVTIEFVDRAGGKGSLELELPRLIVYSRVQPDDWADTAPWSIDAGSIPAPSYRVAPGLLLALLVAGSLVFVVAAAGLAYLGRPRRQVHPEPVDEPEPEPEPLLNPLERALELLEDAAGGNGAADRRRSLELVAEVLDERGEEDGLVRAARERAWSPSPPSPAVTRDLAARVRTALEEELRRLEQERRRQAEEHAQA